MPKTQGESLYSVHPGVAMEAAGVADLKNKTGRTLEEWIRLIKESGPPTRKERALWLKTHHNLGTNYAGWIAECADGKLRMEDYDPEALVAAMYAGPKAGLRPIHERLVKLGKKLGKDVRICPCKTIVPLYRRHVFAQIKPTTRTRIDLGLALGKMNPLKRLPKRIMDTGGRAKGDRITHCIPITQLADIDAEVERWLQTAYDLDA